MLMLCVYMHNVFISRGLTLGVASLSESMINNYNFTHTRRGKAIIINNREFNYQLTRQNERTGTDTDAEALESLLCAMNFDVTRHDNLKPTEMMFTLGDGS